MGGTVSILSLCAVIVLLLALRFVYRNWRRKKLRNTPFPAEWKSLLESKVFLYRYLPADLKAQLHGHINVFLAEKRFEGCGGVQITDEIRVTIAALACMLLLNRETDYYPRLKSILVYPHPYMAEDVDYLGSTRVHGISSRVGESWPTGAVVVAWDQVSGQSRDVNDTHNVVLHEFAHQLDQENGVGADGIPILDQRSSYVTWARILGEEYRQLREIASRDDEDGVLDEYGATNEAEFFAVATEAFFEKPLQLKKKHPELYMELKHYYRFDPSERFPGQAV